MRSDEYRIGNVAFCSATGWKGALYYEIVLYYPNGYYGRQDEYIFDEVHQMYYKEDMPNCFIDGSCFKHEESCYTLAIFEKDTEDEYFIRTCGKRPFEISPKDITDFVACVKYGFKFLESLKTEEEWE